MIYQLNSKERCKNIKIRKILAYGIPALILIITIAVTAYLVTNESNGSTRTVVNQKEEEERGSQSLKNLDWDNLYRSINLNENAVPSINKQKIQYELLRALTAKYWDEIKSGYVKIKEIDEFNLEIGIFVTWKNNQEEIIWKTIQLKHLG